MKIKTLLEKHIRTIPWVVIGVCIFLMLAMSYLTLVKIESQQRPLTDTSQRLEELVAQNKELSRQNGVLLERTVYLADRNIYYSKCVARLFSQYTQTQQPIKIDNIFKCELSPQGSGVNSAPSNTPSAQPKQISKSKPVKPATPQTREVCDEVAILFLPVLKTNCRQEPV